MIRKFSGKFGRALAALAAIFLLAGAAVLIGAGEARGKEIPVKLIPRKRIPKQVRYRQAPAFDKRARKNRRLVTETRRSDRQLRRTGSAYEDN